MEPGADLHRTDLRVVLKRVEIKRSSLTSPLLNAMSERWDFHHAGG